MKKTIITLAILAISSLTQAAVLVKSTSKCESMIEGIPWTPSHLVNKQVSDIDIYLQYRNCNGEISHVTGATIFLENPSFQMVDIVNACDNSYKGDSAKNKCIPGYKDAQLIRQ